MSCELNNGVHDYDFTFVEYQQRPQLFETPAESTDITSLCQPLCENVTDLKKFIADGVIKLDNMTLKMKNKVKEEYLSTRLPLS